MTLAGSDGLTQLSQIAGYGIFRALRPEGFFADLTVIELGLARYACLDATAHVFAWSPADGDDPDLAQVDVVELFYVISGHVTATQDRRTVQAAPGQLYILRSGAPFQFHADDDTVIARITVPRDLLSDPTRALLLDVTATALSGSMLVHAALSFFTALGSDEAVPISTLEQTAMEHTVVALTDALIQVQPAPRPRTSSSSGSSRGPGAPRASGEAAATLRAQAIQLIDTQFQDPSLTPDSIALRLGVSLQTLHRAFAGAPRAVATRIRVARLTAIANALATDPTDPPFGTLATQYGFRHPGSASRAFHDHYGISPTSYRREQQAARLGIPTS